MFRIIGVTKYPWVGVKIEKKLTTLFLVDWGGWIKGSSPSETNVVFNSLNLDEMSSGNKTDFIFLNILIRIILMILLIIIIQ